MNINSNSTQAARHLYRSATSKDPDKYSNEQSDQIVQTLIKLHP